ncbi:MAG: SCO family protein [Sedimenticola sp.]
MKYLFQLLLFTLLLPQLGISTASTHAQYRVVRQLGELNGVALGCRHIEQTRRMKRAMVEYLPKIKALGDLFDQASHERFLSLSQGGELCPLKSQFKRQVGKAIEGLQAEFAGQKETAEAVVIDDAVIDGRYLLMNHHGQAVTDEDFRGSFQLIAFGYTHCPDICPTSLAVISTTMDILGDASKRIQPLFVTVDPKRDTAVVLEKYVGYFHPRIIGLTGSLEFVERAARNYKVRYEKVVNEGDSPDRYWMDHTASVYLMGPDGKFLAKFAHGISAQVLADKIKPYL